MFVQNNNVHNLCLLVRKRFAPAVRKIRYGYDHNNNNNNNDTQYGVPPTYCNLLLPVHEILHYQTDYYIATVPSEAKLEPHGPADCKKNAL